MPATPSPPAIALTDVTRRHGTVAAMDAVSLDIAAGSFVALVGTSGSGKSTLLKTINRLVVPDAGQVRIDGRDIAGQAPAMLRRNIGYVFQNIGLFPHLTVGENIAMALRLAGQRRTGDRVAELLALVDLPADYASRSATALSGGQAQRVGIARALAAAPRILLMDEPFGALDPVTRDTLGRAIRALHDRLGLTTLLVTHDMAEALLLADRVLVMDRGRIVGDGSPADLIAGRAGAAAGALVAVPREQAHRLAALERGE
ncbi:ATP-binding cassette domain-containing protein [Sphingomonas sp. BGYR3]|uniref:ATP-binding cassette domain-containing protein n=1 Tax=Sphingomonas sp. BGYR3 TaxID=2975483 RepID=UPI0021A801E8|nr:ATP-binding cassette domain-containing protein [Sphingomonas sp. BGYR3]MDG5488929.1 ATP-binding cassette domain-containing protein [Sphingomonas sp. BGYR3]